MQGSADKAELSRVLRLTRLFPIVWPTDLDCARALSDYAALRLNSGVGVLDILIAATAVGLSATLCTFNVKHFAVVQNLVTAQPYARV